MSSAPLTELVCEINRLHAEVLAVDLVGLERALHIGKLLNELYTAAADLSTQELRQYTNQLGVPLYTQRRYRKIAVHAAAVQGCSGIEDALALIQAQELPTPSDTRRRPRKVTAAMTREMQRRVAAGEQRKLIASDMGVGAYTVTRHVDPCANVASRVAAQSYADRRAQAERQALDRDAAAQAENIAALTRLLDEAQNLARRIGRESESRAFKHAMKDCAREAGRARRAAVRRSAA